MFPCCLSQWLPNGQTKLHDSPSLEDIIDTVPETFLSGLSLLFFKIKNCKESGWDIPSSNHLCYTHWITTPRWLWLSVSLCFSWCDILNVTDSSNSPSLSFNASLSSLPGGRHSFPGGSDTRVRIWQQIWKCMADTAMIIFIQFQNGKCKFKFQHQVKYRHYNLSSLTVILCSLAISLYSLGRQE